MRKSIISQNFEILINPLPPTLPLFYPPDILKENVDF